MLFLSRGRSPSLLMVPGFTRIVETIHGSMPEVRKPIWVKFKPIGTPMIAPGLPTKKKDGEAVGKAQGFVDTVQMSKELQIEEGELIEFLSTHPSHGVEFIGLSDDGTEIAPEDSVFVPNGDGFYCNVCAQQLSTIQGVTGHKQSKKHRQLFEEYLAEQQRAVANAT